MFQALTQVLLSIGHLKQMTTHVNSIQFDPIGTFGFPPPPRNTCSLDQEYIAFERGVYDGARGEKAVVPES